MDFFRVIFVLRAYIYMNESQRSFIQMLKIEGYYDKTDPLQVYVLNVNIVIGHIKL